MVSRASLLTNSPTKFSSIHQKFENPQKKAQICLWIDLLIWSVICGFDPTKPCLRSWSSFILRFPSPIWPIFRGFEDPRRGFPLKNTSSSRSDSRPESPAYTPESPAYTEVSGLDRSFRPETPESLAGRLILTVLPLILHWLISSCLFVPVCVSSTNSKLPHQQTPRSSTPRPTNIIPHHRRQVHHQRRYNLRHLVNPYLPLCVPIP